MEWGIKLKNNEVSNNVIKKLLKKTYKDFIVKIVTLFFIVMVIFFILNLILQKVVIKGAFISNIIDAVFYQGYFIFIIIFIMLIGVLVLVYKLLKKMYSYVSAIYDSSEELFDKNIEYINLPEELSELEKKLNYFKHESIKNERLAIENEKKKDELIVYLAHDIKTPLTSMIGYLSLLDEIDDMPSKQRKNYTKIVLDKSYRLEELMNELFDIARFNSEKIVLEKEELNLNLMIEQIIDDFYPILKELGKKINFNFDESITLYADTDKLSRVFNNLIKNAIYYSKENTDIDIVTSKIDDKAIIKIKNKGKQIPENKLEKIFEKFYRIDSSRTSKTGGSGLGLAISKDIIELHNGKITAESNPKETTFTVELPIEIN